MRSVPLAMVISPVLAGIALTAIGLVLLLTSSVPAGASHGPTTVVVDLVAVDTDTTGNGGSATGGTIGTVEACNTIASVGGTLTIDVIVDEVPTDRGTSGFGFTLAFDPAVVTVTASSTTVSLLGLDPDSSLINVGDTTSPDGSFLGGLADFGGSGIDTPPFAADSFSSETGPGVLVRLTLTAQGNGLSGLNLSSVGVAGDDTNPILGPGAGAIPIGNGKVAVGQACPAGANNPPVANDVNMGTVFTGSTGNAWTPSVSDPDGDPVTCAIVGGISSGGASVGASVNGGVAAVQDDCTSGIYEPPSGLIGSDSFSYIANDGLLDSPAATVSVAVAEPTPTPTPTPVPTRTPRTTPTATATATPTPQPASQAPSTGFGPLNGGGTNWMGVGLTLAGLFLILGGLSSPFAYRAIRRRTP